MQIKKITNKRGIDGILSQNDATFKGTFKKTKFFEEIEDAPMQKRNETHFTHNFSVADGYPNDVWESSQHAAHAYIPEQYPAGYMSNQGI